jgi:pimeloyl-ACP methyl ester carboxylesterase
MYLLQNPLQSQRPGYNEESVNLEADGQQYQAVLHVASAPDSNDLEPVYVPVANGFYEDSRTWQPLAQRLAKIAVRSGQQMNLVTYEDSVPNGVQDILAFRAERLAQVIRSTRTDGSMILAAHSRGWISAVLHATEHADDIDRVMGFGAAGLAPRAAADITNSKIRDISSGQVVSELSTHIGPIDAWDKLLVGQRYLHNSLSYFTGHQEDMYREGAQILGADVISRTVELSERVPTMIWIHERDAYFDAETVHANLDHAGYIGETRDIRTSHLGPIMDYLLAPQLYHDLIGTTAKS